MKIRENAVREYVQNKTVTVAHIAGDFNIADIFTKELKDTNTFTKIRNVITSEAPTTTYPSPAQSKGGIPTYVDTLSLNT